MSNPQFSDFKINPLILQTLGDIGYKSPSPIQAEIIPFLCDGRDVIGQAQTGTGKTAAFALPLLSKIRRQEGKKRSSKPQALVLAPTRELAIQVADAFRKYSANLKDIEVTTICGGKDYTRQLRSLRDGTDIVVGTPGRIMDHMNRGTLDVSEIETLVLDEADEMLRMGFVDDIDWILAQTPNSKQVALFSATMPKAIKNIAEKYLNNPIKIKVKSEQETNEQIEQCYLNVSYGEKIPTLLRILEANKYDMKAMIVFARTKVETMSVGEKLLAHGHRVIVLNGDIDQRMRERSINELKAGRIDILVATDVAARGLDVDRITHVVNYDMPHDAETYLHRIGRTGRAGRSGMAISFVTRPERNMIREIERFARVEIGQYQAPKIDDINKKRIENFESQVLEILGAGHDLTTLVGIVKRIKKKVDCSTEEIAAVLIKMLYKNSPLLLEEFHVNKSNSDFRRDDRPRDDRPRRERSGEGRSRGGDRPRRERSGEERSRGGDRPRRERSFGEERSRGGDRPGFKSERSSSDRPRRSSRSNSESRGKKRNHFSNK